MSRKEFERLSYEQKGELVISKGRYISKRKVDDFLVNLYTFSDLFIELWYSTISNHISNINILDNIDELDIYIEHGLRK